MDDGFGSFDLPRSVDSFSGDKRGILEVKGYLHEVVTHSRPFFLEIKGSEEQGGEDGFM